MNSPKIKIIVVEDEALIALDIKEKLIELGFLVPMTIDNGEDAIKYAGEIMPDIILMDIVLKGDMDGIEAAKQIKEKFNIPSLFLTAYNNSTIVERAMKINPAGYLLKPFDDSKLQEIIIDLNIRGAIQE